MCRASICLFVPSAAQNLHGRIEFCSIAIISTPPLYMVYMLCLIGSTAVVQVLDMGASTPGSAHNLELALSAVVLQG